MTDEPWTTADGIQWCAKHDGVKEDDVDRCDRAGDCPDCVDGVVVDVCHVSWGCTACDETGADPCDLRALVTDEAVTEVEALRAFVRFVDGFDDFRPFSRDLSWVLEELNRQADEIERLRAEIKTLRGLLGVADCRYCRGQGWYEDTDIDGKRVQVQCEWCDRVKTALGVTDDDDGEAPF